MAEHHHPLPSDLDPRDPQFPGKAALLNFQTRCEIKELVVATKNTIAISKELLAEADRMLAKR